MAAGLAAIDHGDGSYSLEEEIELLEAIYIHELTIEGPRERPLAVSVLLHPSTGDEEDKRFVCLTLVIDLPEKYPSELPSIHIKTPRGLSEAHIESILANLRELAESCHGRPMLYELIEYAKESLTDNNTPSCACAICLCHFQDSDEFTKTECYHYFHCGCLARYIEFSLQQEMATEDSTKVECPMCRLPVTYNLAELKTVASRSEVNEEEVVYKPSVDIRKLQKKMSSLFQRQKRKGGVIDVEQERNRFLIDITSVREEETVPECEPPTGLSTGPEMDTVSKNSLAEHPVNNIPKREGVAKEASQPNEVIRKDKSEKKDKKEFYKYSGTSRGPFRGPRRPVDKTGQRSSEEKVKQYEQRRTEKKRPTTCDRPKSAEQREKEKLSVKQPEKQASETKPDIPHTGLEAEKNTSVLDPPGKAVKGVSGNSNSSQNSYGERPRSARRGRGRSGRGRTSDGSKKESRDGVRDTNKSSTNSGEVVKRSEVAGPSERVSPPLEKNGRHQNHVNNLQENPSARGGRTSKKDKVCKPPPGLENLKSDKERRGQSSNDSRPPPGFEQCSTRPRPPPGLGNLAEGAGQTTSQSIAS